MFRVPKRKTMKRNIICAIVLFAMSGGAAGAHEWFAVPGEAREFKAGDDVQIIVYSTHHFMVGEGIQDASRNSFFVLQNNRLTDTTVRLSRNEELRSLTGSFNLPVGAPTVVVVNNVGRISNATPVGAKTASKATVGALGVSVTKTTLSEAWCKIYINPDSQDKTFSNALGLPLEIVPVTNPADIAVGKPAVFKVLLRGKPLRDAEVNATYKSYNSKDEEAWAVKGVKTDANGQVTINIPAAQNAKDIWIVKAEYSGSVSDHPDYDAESFSSLAAFTVRK